MINVNTVMKELMEQFGFTTDQIHMPRMRRVSLEVPYVQFRPVLEFCVNKLQFRHLCTITGLDEGETLAFIYHIAHPDGTVFNLKTRVPRTAPVLQTITDIFPDGIGYERELVDLLGAQVEGLPPGNRYPLPDNWPAGQYPLRKDWKAETLNDMK